MYGAYPFDASNTTQLMTNILTNHPDFNSEHRPSNAAVDFIRKLMHHKAKTRYTAAQALQDPWITRKQLASEDKERGVDRKRIQNARRLSTMHRAKEEPLTEKLQKKDEDYKKGRCCFFNTNPLDTNTLDTFPRGVTQSSVFASTSVVLI